MKTKLLTWYLPQYHSIPENNEFWGEGFTDWVTVRNAKPLYRGHQQPRIPLDNNYYDLAIRDSVEWQARIAKEHGIFGFGIYHYWFNNEKNLLTKPAEIIRDNKDIDINYFFAWDNASWVRSWSALSGNAWAPVADQKYNKNGRTVLIPYILGKENDWENHFNHLIDYFNDSRYIKVDNKPMFIILQYDNDIQKMCDYWDNLARQNGFDGMYFVFKNKRWFDWGDRKRFNYEPHHDGWLNPTVWERRIEKIKRLFHLDTHVMIYDYDTTWKRILKSAESSSRNEYLGGFVNYDDSPRRSRRGKIVKGANPEKFKYYLSELCKISDRQNKDFLFLTAWNEWGEGAYLEPDTIYGYEYLNAIKEITKK